MTALEQNSSFKHLSWTRIQKSLEAATSKPPVVIFDLDGTVFDVGYRHLEIISRAIQLPQIEREHPDLCKKAEKIGINDVRYSIEATLNQGGISRYSEHSAHFIHQIETFWLRHFFTDDLVVFDKPYAGALECVQHFYKQGAHIVYLSGRDIPNMSQGTIKSLEANGFPHTGHRISICLKPAYGQDDLLFKKQSLETIQQLGPIAATFDNEPANVDLFLRAFPESTHFHFASHYAKEMELSGAGFYRIQSFEELGF